MPRLSRSALVPYSPGQMFDLVRDVTRYPEFLGWIRAAEVHEETDERQLATLEVRLGGMARRFTTLNRLVPERELSMQLYQGPFNELQGRWLFEPLGGGARVSLDLHFEIAGSQLLRPFQHKFGKMADRMVGDFSRRAETVYG